MLSGTRFLNPRDARPNWNNLRYYSPTPTHCTEEFVMGVQVVYKETFRNQILRIDGKRFEQCYFEKCLLEYGGIEEVSFANCTLRDVDWSFVGPASNTINFLSSLHNGFGELGRQVVEQLFESIRRGEPGQTDPHVLKAIRDAEHQRNVAFSTAQVHAVSGAQMGEQAEAHKTTP